MLNQFGIWQHRYAVNTDTMEIHIGLFIKRNKANTRGIWVIKG